MKKVETVKVEAKGELPKQSPTSLTSTKKEEKKKESLVVKEIVKLKALSKE